MNSLHKKNDKKILFAAFAVFTILVSVCYAMFFNATGPDAPLMMQFFGTDNTMQGFIVTLQAIASMAVSIILSLFAERFSKITIQLIGAVLIAVAAINITFIPSYIQQGNGYELLVCYIMIGGVGISITNVMNSSILSDVYPDKKKVLLPIMQGVYGIACMLIPIIVSVTTFEDTPESFANPYLIIGMLSVFAAVLFGITGHSIKKYTVYSDNSEIKNRARNNPAEIYRQPYAWIIFIAGFLYFMFQIGLVTWFPTFAINDLGVDFSTAALFNSAFFAGELAMRFLLVPLLKKMSPERCYVMFGAFSIVAIILTVTTQNPTFMMAMLAVTGLLEGGSAPLLMILILEKFPERSASSSAMISISVNLATITGPLIMGAIADASGGSFLFAMYLIIACLAASVLIIGLHKVSENKKAKIKLTE